LWCNSSSRIFLVFWKTFIKKKKSLGNVHLMFIFGCCK
jgi:hypothetical protein